MIEYSNLFVCLMGIGTVFIGLTCLVALTKIMSAVILRLDGEKKQESSAAPVSQSPKHDPETELSVAISAALAEELSTDISNIHIVSITKV